MIRQTARVRATRTGESGSELRFFPECLRLLHYEFRITVPENQEDE